MEITNIRLVISQPNVRKAPSEWDCKPEELEWFTERFTRKAEDCFEALERVRAEGITAQTQLFLNPGEKQCSYCKAKADCPGYAKMVGETVFGSFDALQAPEVENVRAGLPITPHLIAAYAMKLELIRGWCKAIEEKALAMARAGEIGREHGVKMVAGRMGNRAWDDPAAVESLLLEKKFKHDDIYEKKVISPTEAEKRLKALKPRVWKDIEAHIKREEGKPKVVALSAPGQEISVAPTADGFDDVSQPPPTPPVKEDSVDDLL